MLSQVIMAPKKLNAEAKNLNVLLSLACSFKRKLEMAIFRMNHFYLVLDFYKK